MHFTDPIEHLIDWQLRSRFPDFFYGMQEICPLGDIENGHKLKPKGKTLVCMKKGCTYTTLNCHKKGDMHSHQAPMPDVDSVEDAFIAAIDGKRKQEKKRDT